MPVGYGKRLPVDPRVIDRIQRSPTMMGEQGTGFMQSWGGPTKYKDVSRLTRNQRTCLYAVEGGLSTAEEISIALDVPVSKVETVLAQLERKGLVKLEAIPQQV